QTGCTGDWMRDFDRAFSSMSFVFPAYYTYYHPTQLMTFTTITVDCKYMPDPRLALAVGEMVCSKYGDQLKKCPAYLEVVRRVVRRCYTEDGKPVKAEHAVVGSQHTAMVANLFTPLLSGPLNNAFLWMYVKHEHEVLHLLERIALKTSPFSSSEADDLVRQGIPITNIWNMYFAAATWPRIVAKLRVVDSTERAAEHPIYMAVFHFPNYAFAGASSLKDVAAPGDAKLPMVTIPVLVTFGRHNVHPGVAFYVTPKGSGEYELYLPPTSAEDVLKLANYMYCEGESCTPPPQLDALKYNLDEFKRLTGNKYFTRNEALFYEVLQKIFTVNGDGDEAKGLYRSLLLGAAAFPYDNIEGLARQRMSYGFYFGGDIVSKV
ncbi:MAG: hypothetical protein ACP5MH_11560, partial [Thermoproteus sp.]